MDIIKDIDLTYLDDVEIEDKDIIIKSIRFNPEEHFMLKYIKYNNKRFATYVKELILQDIISRHNVHDEETKIDINNLRDIVRKILKEELGNEEAADVFMENHEELKDPKLKEDREILLGLMGNRGQ